MLRAERAETRRLRGSSIRDHASCSQGRNFGLKSGGTNSEGERSALGPEGRGEENGEEVPSPHLTLGSGRASWRSLGRKRFYCNLNSADLLC